MSGDLTVKVVSKLTGYSAATITRMCQRGGFPNAYQLGGPGCQWHIPADDIVRSYPEARRDVVLAKLEQLAQVYDLQ